MGAHLYTHTHTQDEGVDAVMSVFNCAEMGVGERESERE